MLRQTEAVMKLDRVGFRKRGGRRGRMAARVRRKGTRGGRSGACG